MKSTDYDSILTALDTNVIDTSVYYNAGKEMPDHGIPMAERSYSASNDDFIIVGMIMMMLIIAILLYRGRSTIIYRIKEFFTTKRTYSKENVNENNREIYSTFFLTSISALSLSLVMFDYIGMKVGFERAIGIPYWLFAADYVVLVGFIYIKAWFYSIVNWTFFNHESNEKWMSGYLFLTSLTAFLCFPVSLIAILVENGKEIVIWCLIFIFFLYELLLFFKLFINFAGKFYDYILLFLYFCSVELMPAIVMYRLIVWVTNNFIVKI